MAKIAIYDKFYGSTEDQRVDIIGQALADSTHDVIGSATHIRPAAQQILHFAAMDATERPELVIMGGMLEGEFDYRKRPPTIAEPCTVRRRTGLGVKEEIGKYITFLLPQFEKDGITYHFPTIITVGNVPEDPPGELLRQWSAGMSGIAARVLSRLVETYLPETGRLGVSVDPMIDAVLSADAVNRHGDDAVQQLQGHIQRLTGEG